MTSDDARMLHQYVARLQRTVKDQERQIEELRAAVAALLAPNPNPSTFVPLMNGYLTDNTR